MSSPPKERFYCLFVDLARIFRTMPRDRFECHYLSSGGKWDFSCPAPGRFNSRHGAILHDYSRFNVHSDSHDTEDWIAFLEADSTKMCCTYYIFMWRSRKPPLLHQQHLCSSAYKRPRKNPLRAMQHVSSTRLSLSQSSPPHPYAYVQSASLPFRGHPVRLIDP